MNQNKILIAMIIVIAIIAIASLLYYSQTKNTVSVEKTIQSPDITPQVPAPVVQKPIPAMNPAIYIPIKPEPALPPICDADIYWDVPTNITCPVGKKLQFTKFLYGRPSNSRCQDSGGRGCMQLDLTSQANVLILNNEFKQTGAVSSWRGFNDHCPGVQKQADVEYACI